MAIDNTTGSPQHFDPDHGAANYASPIVRQRLAEIRASNASLAGGAGYVSPVVREQMQRPPVRVARQASVHGRRNG